MNQSLFQFSGVDQVIPVHGIEGAKSFSMGANCRVPLFDDSEDVFYIKSTDANGFPSLKVFDFTERKIIENGSELTLNDIRSIIKEELKTVLEPIKEDLINAQQSISESRNTEFTAAPSTESNDESDANTGKSNAGSKYYYKQSANGKSKGNSSDVSNTEKQPKS